MITRGHYIGEILDELVSISEQIQIRTGLGLTDLPLYAENFCRDILTTILGSTFKNLNAERQNIAGIDLGSTALRMAFQVTATNTSDKINDTLKAITDDQRKTYDKFIVLILRNKQKSYTLIPSLASKNKFSEADIWDIRDLAKKAMDLDIGMLQTLHSQIRQYTMRLRVELELRPTGGEFQTNGYGLWEAQPTPKVGDGSVFIDYIENELGEGLSEKAKARIQPGLHEIAGKLSRLPRLTREFLVMLFHRREPGGTTRIKQSKGWESMLFSVLEHLYNGPDLRSELDILEHVGFVSIEEYTLDTHEDGPTAVGFRISSKSEDLNWHFLEYLEHKNICLRKAIGDVDLSVF